MSPKSPSRKKKNETEAAMVPTVVVETTEPETIPRPPVADRIAHIRELMITGKWVTGRTKRHLAKYWGVAEGTIDVHASEASRSINMQFGAEDSRARVLAMIEEAAAIARQADPRNAAKALVQVARLLADVTGAKSPEKIAVTTATGEDVVPFGFAVSETSAEPVEPGGRS
jgi:hypothetical protein